MFSDIHIFLTFQNEEAAVEDSQTEITDVKSMLKGLPERKRRTMLRYTNGFIRNGQTRLYACLCSLIDYH